MYEEYKFKRGLLAKLIEWDEDREAYIDRLHEEIQELKKQLIESVHLSAQMADASDQMKLELIMSGALSRPKKEK